MRRPSHTQDRVCPACGARFFTRVGLAEHERTTCAPAPVPRTHVLTDAGRESLRARGRSVARLNNARRVRCGTCALVSTPSGIGNHQAATGHIGRTGLPA